MKISTILDQIDTGSIALPVFQRGYVWNRDQVRNLMRSLYHRYPVGSLIVWNTKTENAKVKGDGNLANGNVDLLLDGQQRITSLYGIVRGHPPKFFDGNARAFTDLFFDLEDEVFEFYAPLKMKNQPRWLDVTAIMKGGIGTFVQQVAVHYSQDPKLNDYLGRLTTKLAGIKDIDLHPEKVTGADKTIEVVVDIFNEVNKGGTKLSQGDLALAKICATWPEARQEMKDVLAKWQQAGFNFSLDWLLRNVNAIVNGEAIFTKLADSDAATFQAGIVSAEKAGNYLLNLISGRLGLDHDRVLGGRYAFPVMSRYLTLRGGQLSDAVEQDRLLYWYVQALLWGRFSGSTESVLNQDLRLIKNDAGDLDRLINQLKLSRGELTVRPQDFAGYGQGGRFYPLLYLLTRVCGACDWGNNLPLTAHLLGKTSGLEVHHIFPKALLYKHANKYTQAEVNAIANFCFLTKTTNLKISDREPEIYFAEIEKNYPGALASQWIPMDQTLWKLENYRDFLAERRLLLAHAANNFLEPLGSGQVTSSAAPPAVFSTTAPPIAASADSDDEELLKLGIAVEQQGYPGPEISWELAGSNQPPLTADLAWPAGVQQGLSVPLALVRDDSAAQQAFQAAGFRVCLSVADLQAYLQKEIGLAIASA